MYVHHVILLVCPCFKEGLFEKPGRLALVPLVVQSCGFFAIVHFVVMTCECMQPHDMGFCQVSVELLEQKMFDKKRGRQFVCVTPHHRA